MRYYMVFERTQGSRGWTPAYKPGPKIGKSRGVIVAFFGRLDLATKFAETVQKRRGYWGGKPNQRKMDAYICIVDLPSKENLPVGDDGTCQCGSGCVLGVCPKCGREIGRIL